MSLLLNNKSVSDEIREKNNSNHNYKIVFSVLSIIFIYMYFFTQIYQYIGIESPEKIFENFYLIEKNLILDTDGNLSSDLEITYANNIKYNNDSERLVFFIILSLTFLVTYFSKVKYKRIFIVIATLLIFFILFSWNNVLMFLSMHLILYLLFHNKNEKSNYLSFLPGGMIFFAFFTNSFFNITFLQIIFSILSSIFFGLYYKFLILKLLEDKKVSNILRTIFIQLTMITIIVVLIINSIYGYKWIIPVGIFYFFIQWQRLILYHIEYKDGLIPLDLSLLNYSIVFFNPATVINCVDGHNIGSGYKYINNNYLIEDKNKIIFSGVKILTLALFYLVLYYFFSNTIKILFEYFLRVPIFVSLEDLIKAHLKGKYLSTSTVLFSTLISQIEWFFIFGGIVHFKVGVWRIFGFKLNSYFDKPWLATNLMSFWTRYSFYFREFLVRAFYYPVFLNFFKKNQKVRIFVATFASTCIGNYTWGHIPEIILVKGLETKNLVYALPRWPYFFLLGLGVSLTQIYLLTKKTKRKPWTK